MKLISIMLVLAGIALFNGNANAYVECVAATASGNGTSSTVYYCSDNGIYNTAPQGAEINPNAFAGGDVGGGAGSSQPLGSQANPIKIPVPAADDCGSDTATAAANAAFKAYWEVALKPRIAPDGKNYAILFANGLAQQYTWVNIIQSSYSITPAANSTCHNPL